MSAAAVALRGTRRGLQRRRRRVGVQLLGAARQMPDEKTVRVSRRPGHNRFDELEVQPLQGHRCAVREGLRPAEQHPAELEGLLAPLDDVQLLELQLRPGAAGPDLLEQLARFGLPDQPLPERGRQHAQRFVERRLVARRVDGQEVLEKRPG